MDLNINSIEFVLRYAPFWHAISLVLQTENKILFFK